MTNESVVDILSGALCALGVTVILGWHFDVPSVVQLHSAFPPMQYNTALCFLLSGLATLHAGSRRRVAMACALAVVAISVVSLLQYTVGRGFGIDELLMNAYITVATSHPGRMAPQTAIGFALAGMAVLALTLLKPSPHTRLAAEIAASVLCGLGIAALIGYCVGVEPAYGWGNLTRAAVHTAGGFVVLGVAVLLNAWRAHSKHAAGNFPPLALPVGTASLAVALSLFQALSQWQLERIDEATARNVDRAATVLEDGLRRYLENFAGLATKWGRAGGEPQRTWDEDVARFLRDENVFMAIAHGGPNGTLDWIFPSAPFPGHIGFDYSANATRATWLTRAVERGGPVLTPPLPLKSGRPGVLIIAPLWPEIDGTGPFAVAAAVLEELLRPSAVAIPGYRLAVFQDEQRVYGAGADAERAAYGSRSREVRLDGAALRLEATPLPEAIAALRSPLPTLVLVSGLLASLLLAVTAQAAQIASRRARELAAANVSLASKKKQLERLALFDELTGLGNRNLLLLEFDKAIEASRRESLPLALLLLDLDGFKAINDTYGHDAGDRVLQELAARMAEALPLTAEAFRSGGDEFAVLSRQATDEEALAIAHAIERAIEAPMPLGDEQHRIQASIGIALYPRHGQDRVRLLRAADVAMYQAKRAAVGVQVASEESPTAVLRSLQPRR